MPDYTEAARKNGVKGTVVLVVLLSPKNGVSVADVVNRLPDGLTEEAMKAATRIKFQPAIDKNGRPVTVEKRIEYVFNP